LTVARQDENLLLEIQQGALDPATPLAHTLRKVVALGGAVGSKELRDWAGLELRGYVGSPVELPAYRKVPASIEVDGFAGAMQATGYRISRRLLPVVAQEKIDEEVPLTNSIGELEAMARQAAEKDGHLKLSLPGAQELVMLMNSEGKTPLAHITALYWTTSRSAMEGAIDQIRTSLVELVAEMRAGTPAGSDDLPSSTVAAEALNIVIQGERNSININAAAASGSGAHTVTAQARFEAPGVEAAWPALRDELEELGVPEVELEELHTALLTDGDPKGAELGAATTSWLGRLAMKVSSGAIALAGAASTEVISHSILKAFGLA
jgi:hypothetical protein